MCKTAVNTCQEGYWKCDNSPTCIQTPFICDEVVDCPDQSDESPEHCDVSSAKGGNGDSAFNFMRLDLAISGAVRVALGKRQQSHARKGGSASSRRVGHRVRR